MSKIQIFLRRTFIECLKSIQVSDNVFLYHCISLLLYFVISFLFKSFYKHLHFLLNVFKKLKVCDHHTVLVRHVEQADVGIVHGIAGGLSAAYDDAESVG